MSTYNVYQDGAIVATYKNNEKQPAKRRQTRKEAKQTAQRRRRDARLLKAFAR